MKPLEMPRDSAEQALRTAALEYHRSPTRGKLAISPTKPLANQRDLSLAYSPGVAYACLEIERDPALAAEYTSRANLVGVITNGTAVLGLGDIGPLAGKPVMEGKACLFKKFAGIDVFDIELAETNVDRLVDIIAALEPTLGGINLEDIKAPECFEIERRLSERLSIPVFHDDQHGTAIISAAALLNGLELTGKRMEDVRVVVSGAGAAAIACLGLWTALGIRETNVLVVDSKGVLHSARRELVDASKQRWCRDTGARTLADALVGADVFLGCSAAGVVSGDMVKSMARQPILLALANPEPEIRPEIALAARPDAIIATGRSDYPNQVNNVLCFPYIFRGALDSGATRITDAMKLACVREIAELAKSPVSEEVASAYAGQELRFGSDYLIPKPFDSRLILRIAPAVARAAAESGVATRPIADLDAYRQSLEQFVTQTGLLMRPVFEAAKSDPARVVYAEGEDLRVLQALPAILDEGLARPTLIGRPEVIANRLQQAGLPLLAGRDFDLVDPEHDARFRDYWTDYRARMGRNGITPELAKAQVRRSNTLIASLMVERGDADAMLCGLVGRFDEHLGHIRDVIGLRAGAPCLAALNALMLPEHTLFVTDTFVNEEPDAEHLAGIALMAAEVIRHFGLPPKVAFLSHSMFGSSDRPAALRMRAARERFASIAPEIECDGEMHGDAALSDELRRSFLPETTLSGSANLLVMPNLDAANILFNVLKMIGSKGVTIGPILLGAARPAHILTPSATMRRVLNMTALASAQAVKARA